MVRGTQRKVLFGTLIGVAMIVFIGLAIQAIVRQSYERSQVVEDSNQAILQLTRALSSLKDAETGQRGYLLTDDEEYLTPYTTGRDSVIADLGAARATLNRSNLPVGDLAALEAGARAKLDELERTISLRRSGDAAGALTAVKTNKGKALMDRLRQQIGGIEATVQQHLKELEQRRVESRTRVVAGIFGSMFVLLVCLVFFGAMILHDLRLRERAEAALAEQREWFRTTLVSIGDGLLATDAEGRVVLMNPVAERLTGWLVADAKGRDHSEVFRIVNAHSRAQVESPIDRVIREGVIVGLANHTVLIDRQGVERPIEDSGAPIRGSSGNVDGVVLVFRDVSDRDRAAVELRESEGFSRSILDSSGDCIEVIRPDGRVESINRAGQVLMAIDDPLSVAGQSWPDLWGEHADEARRAISTAISDSPGRFSGARAPSKGASKWWDVVVTPVLNQGGAVVKLLTVSRDISERKVIEVERESLLAAERAARSDAERTSRVKDEFVATLSHELRTPLSAILGWTQLLRKRQSSGEELQSGLETIERNARAQAQMIDELLDLSRIVSGKLRLDVQRVDVPHVIHAAIDTVRPAAEAKDIRLQITVDPRTNIVRGDPTRLQQVVWNLLSNAVKFTPKGGKVQVTLARVNSHVEVSVSDTGKGIRPEFLPHVFERFRQEDSTTTRRFGGLGLGLSIVKQLVELHGGVVRASSGGEGEGSQFVVELPVISVQELARAEGAGQTAGRERPPTETVGLSLRGIKVLVVDDEADSRELVKRFLREAEAEVSVAGSVQEGLDIFKSFKPDVLLSDIGMPIQDGYELIRRIRTFSAADGGTTPAAALTALARTEDRTRALLAGFQVHVAKPIDSSELLAVVASLSLMRRGAE